MLGQFARAVGSTKEIRTKLAARIKQDAIEKARRQEEHNLLVARYEEKPDEILLAAQSQVASIDPVLGQKFSTLTRHQQLLLVNEAGPDLRRAVEIFTQIPVELRHKAAQVASSPTFRQSYKRTFTQVLNMFEKAKDV